MLLNKIEDPRDNLEKARRSELFAFARQHRVTEIPTEDMPAILMRRILRSKGLTRIAVPRRILGQHVGATASGQPAPQTSDQGREVNADDDLLRQFMAQQQQPAAAPGPDKPVADMNITELRKACKARGIKLERKDNLLTLRAKLNG